MAALDTDLAGVTAPTTVSTRYARALLSIADDARAEEPGALDRIASDLEALLALWRGDAGFRAFVADPRLDAAAQQRAAAAIIARTGIGADGPGEVRRLLGVLIANHRLATLPQVAAAFAALVNERRGQQVAAIATAHPLTDTQRAQLSARLIEAGFAGVRLEERVDPDLLGGLVVRIGSRLYDNSIKSKLQRLHTAMKGLA